MKLLKDVFPPLSAAKIKGVFGGRDTRKFIKNGACRDSLNDVERCAYEPIINTAENFLGKNRSPDHKAIVTELLNSF